MNSEFVLSIHANEQIERRAIDIQLVYDVLNNPEQIVRQENELIYQSIVVIKQRRYLLRIFINEKVSPKVVITVYLTSKIEKYYEG